MYHLKTSISFMSSFAAFTFFNSSWIGSCILQIDIIGLFQMLNVVKVPMRCLSWLNWKILLSFIVFPPWVMPYISCIYKNFFSLVFIPEGLFHFLQLGVFERVVVNSVLVLMQTYEVFCFGISLSMLRFRYIVWQIWIQVLSYNLRYPVMVVSDSNLETVGVALIELLDS